jgi:hypothetical protein
MVVGLAGEEPLIATDSEISPRPATDDHSSVLPRCSAFAVSGVSSRLLLAERTAGVPEGREV